MNFKNISPSKDETASPEINKSVGPSPLLNLFKSGSSESPPKDIEDTLVKTLQD